MESKTEKDNHIEEEEESESSTEKQEFFNQNQEKLNKVSKEVENDNKYIQKLFESTIGNNITFPSPFGDKQIIYTDFTASGRGIKQIESFISDQVLPFYANVHSSCGYLADQSEAFRSEAKTIVRRYCDTDENNAIIFTGQGTTSCINKLIKLLNLKEYNQFHLLLSRLNGIYENFKKSNLSNELFEQINVGLINDVKDMYRKLFQVTNFCYANRWGGFDCVICRMGFTTEAQYNEHANNEIHKQNLESFNISTKNSNFIEEIAKQFDISDKEFLYKLMQKTEFFKPIIFISRYEHNSNLLPWRETTSKIVYILDLPSLEEELNNYKDYYIKMGTFTATSNITGKYLDVDKYSILMHKHNGLAFFDYASGAPYLKMDMNKVLPESYRELLFQNSYIDEEEEHLCFKDAMFFSPHKFLGGVNTPGVLIIQQRCVRNLLVPSEPGGGSVLFVTEHTQNYVKNIESREESGTPDIIGGVRIGLSLLLREKIDHTYVLEIEDRINQHVKEKLFNIPNLHILSDTEFIGDQPHTPIYSFLISYKGKFFHPNFISALLNDLFGIQSRPGCSCASLFGQYLLGIPQEYLHKLEILTCTGKEIYRPGYTRLNFPYFYPQYLIDYIIFAIEFCTKHAFKFLPLYAFKMESGKFYHRNEEEKKKWLNDIKFEDGNIIIPNFFEEKAQEFITEKVINNLKSQAIALVDNANMKFLIKNTIGKSKMNLQLLFEENEKERWFLIYNDVEDLLNNLKEEEYSKYYTTPLEVDFELKCYPREKIIETEEPKKEDKEEGKEDNSVPLHGFNFPEEPQEKKFREARIQKPFSRVRGSLEISKNIMKLVGEASKDFDMIKPNDRILVGVSGGKDSLTLIHVLLEIQKKIPFRIDVGAITVNPESEDYDPSILKDYFRELNVPYFYETDAIMKKAKQNLQNNSICSYCARMKRGIIYNTARREGYNVIALGQHLDDLAESFLMSVFHNGLLRTMKANYTIDAGDLRVIRPFIYCREKLFKDFAMENNLPVIQDNCPACFSSPKERQRMKVLLAQQENLFPALFCSLQKAMMPLMRGVLKDPKEQKDDVDI